MRSSTSLLGRDLLGIASEMLEILNKIFTIISNYNLFPCLLCVPWIIYWSTIKKKTEVYFVFHSICTTFDLQSKVLSFGNKKENRVFFLYSAHLFVPLQRN